MGRSGSNARLSSQPWEVEEAELQAPLQPGRLSETLIQRKENKENDHGSEIFCPYLRLISKL